MMFGCHVRRGIWHLPWPCIAEVGGVDGYGVCACVVFLLSHSPCPLHPHPYLSSCLSVSPRGTKSSVDWITVMNLVSFRVLCVLCFPAPCCRAFVLPCMCRVSCVVLSCVVLSCVSTMFIFPLSLSYYQSS